MSPHFTTRPCAVVECDRPSRTKGFCTKHYYRWRVNGDPTVVKPPGYAAKPITERFLRHVNKDGPTPEHAPELGQCWLWTGADNGKGYGVFWDRERLVSVHRFAYEQEYGPIEDRKELDHLCRNHSCMRPTHVEPVTHLTNLHRGVSPTMLAYKAGTCVKGHPKNEENTYWRKDRPGHWNCRQCRRDREKAKKI
jgi:hypothetical protein